jgi:drug/metabolite transporter (DMT)-like permease
MASSVRGLAPGRPEPAATPATADGPPGPAAASDQRPGVWLTNVLLLVMALIWGVNFSVLKIGTRYFDPLAFNGLRMLLAGLVLAAIAWGRRALAPTRADAVRLAVLGVLGHGFYQVCFIEGIARTTASTAALVMAAGPAFIGVVGRLLGVERPSRAAWAGIGLQLLGMAGVVFGSATQAPLPGQESGLAGPAFILVAALAWACYAVLLKPFTGRVDPMHLSAWTLLGGVATLVPLAAPGIVRLDAAAVPALGWGAVGYSAILAMVVAYLFYYRGVRVVGPVRTAMFSNLQPIVALAVAALTLGERPGPWQLTGAAAIAAGLVVSRR